MAFGNRPNNNTDLNVNTNGIQFYNMESFDPSTLQLNFWNGLLALKICPALPENKREDMKKYDYDTFITCLLTPQKAYDLYRVAIDEFYPSYKENPNSVKSIGVPSGDGFIQISSGYKIPGYTGKEAGIVLTIYKDVDSNAKTDSMISYEFRKGSIIREYNNRTGEFDDDRTVDSEFFAFMLYLKESSKALTEAYAHSVRYSDRFYRAKEISNSQKVMEALNISIDSGKKNYRKGGTSPFSSRRSINDNESRSAAPIENSDLEDIYNELES